MISHHMPLYHPYVPHLSAKVRFVLPSTSPCSESSGKLTDQVQPWLWALVDNAWNWQFPSFGCGRRCIPSLCKNWLAKFQWAFVSLTAKFLTSPSATGFAPSLSEPEDSKTVSITMLFEDVRALEALKL